MGKNVALVTGGTGGIGTATCLLLSASGFETYALDHPSRAEKIQDSWLVEVNQTSSSQIQAVFADVGDYESCAKMAESLLNETGGVTVLVNAAGITRDALFTKMQQHQWNEVMSSNLDSLFNVTHQFINPMIEQGYGRIVNISSVSGGKGQFGQTNYAATKAGVHGFTKALAQEVANKGITVNTISPGYVATPMVMAIRDDIREKIVDLIPVGRMGQPEEIAHVIGFLVDEKSGYITGANIDINGGLWMH